MKFKFSDLEVVNEDKTIARVDIDDVEYETKQAFSLGYISHVTDMMMNDWGPDTDVEVILDKETDKEEALGFANPSSGEMLIIAPRVKR